MTVMFRPADEILRGVFTFHRRYCRGIESRVDAPKLVAVLVAGVAPNEGLRAEGARYCPGIESRLCDGQCIVRHPD